MKWADRNLKSWGELEAHPLCPSRAWVALSYAEELQHQLWPRPLPGLADMLLPEAQERLAARQPKWKRTREKGPLGPLERGPRVSTRRSETLGA